MFGEILTGRWRKARLWKGQPCKAETGYDENAAPGLDVGTVAERKSPLPGVHESHSQVSGALSTATDLAAGNPMGSALTATVLAVRLGRRLGGTKTR